MTKTALPTGARADRSRQAIMSAALDAFLEKGYEVSIEAIAQRAGVSKVTLYNHFSGKQEIFVAVTAAALDAAFTTAAASMTGRGKSSTSLETTLIRMADACVDGLARPEVYRLKSLVAVEIARFPELAEAWREGGPNRFFKIFTGVLKDACNAGELAIDDLELAAIQLFGMTLYPHFVMAAYGTTINRKRARQLVREGVRTFLARWRATT